KDTDRKLIRGTAIPASFVTDEMDNSMSRRQVLVLDCCHSGAFARGSKGVPGGSVGTAEAFEGTGFGRVVLTASDATQYAWEGDQVVGQAENSVFTSYLARGLKTGEADMDGDGKITVDEIYDYVYSQVVSRSSRQTPAKWSYKEQGNIILAHTPVKADIPSASVKVLDVEDEELARIEEYYTRGLSAFWLEEWDKAARYFDAIVDVRPDYEDASVKLTQARRQIRLEGLYQKASGALEQDEWPEALKAYEILAAEAPDYKDVAERLEHVKKQKLLADLYREAQNLSQGGHWQAVINVFDRIRQIEPDYPDADGLVATAEKELAAQKHQEMLNNLFSQALREMDAGNWVEARQMLAQIQEMQPGYQQSEQLLERVEREIASQEARQQRTEQIRVLYEQAQGLARARQYRQAMAKIDEIKSLDPQFTDPKGISPAAQKALDEEELETARQNQLAALYAEAVRLLESGQYQDALQKMGEVRSLDPQYPDNQKVQKTARKKLESLSRRSLSERWGSVPRPWKVSIGVIGLLGLVGIFFGLAAIIRPGPTKELDIPQSPGADVEPARAAQTRPDTIEMGIHLVTDSDWAAVGFGSPPPFSPEVQIVNVGGDPSRAEFVQNELRLDQPIEAAQRGNVIFVEANVVINEIGNKQSITFYTKKGCLNTMTVEVFNIITGTPIPVERYEQADCPENSTFTVELDKLVNDQLSPAPNEFVYDDFNDPQYDGIYNDTLWNGSGDCRNVQNNGMLVINESTCQLSVKKPDRVKGSAIGLFGTRIQLSSDHNGKPLTSYLTLESRISMGYGVWEARCDQAADNGNVHFVFVVQRYGGTEEEVFYVIDMPAEYDRWYTLELVVDPGSMTVTCMVEGEPLGSYTPPNADILRNSDFNRTLVNVREDGAVGTVLIDDVVIIPP
ncbi:MAG: hypothetical protein ACWGO1_04540, partial [Anaerolineales bacterium]